MKRVLAALTFLASLYALGNLSLSTPPSSASGSGDVVGPASATSSRVATYADSTGKLLGETASVGVGAAGSADSKLYVSGGSLTNSNNRGVFSDMTATTSATGSMAAYLARLNSPNSSFTTGIATLYDTASTIKGASHTITRLRNIGCTTPTDGTNNACLTDNTSWTGDYFINQSGTRASLFSGNIGIADTKGILFANTSTKFINVDSGYDINGMRFAMPTGGYFSWTINGTAGAMQLDSQEIYWASGISLRFPYAGQRFGYSNAGGAPAPPTHAYFKNIYVDTGANTTIGTATLSSGTVEVNTTAVATGDTIFLTLNTPGGTLGAHYSAPVASIVNGTKFVINAVDAAGAVVTTDTSTVNWWILKTF